MNKNQNENDNDFGMIQNMGSIPLWFVSQLANEVARSVPSATPSASSADFWFPSRHLDHQDNVCKAVNPIPIAHGTHSTWDNVLSFRVKRFTQINLEFTIMLLSSKFNCTKSRYKINLGYFLIRKFLIWSSNFLT